jgi:dTMP kinase
MARIKKVKEKPSFPGKFIVIEGLDGSGQSTQAKLIFNYLKERRKKVLLTKEPTTYSKPAKEIRKILDKKKKIDPFRLQLLFARDRKEHLEKEIIPALKRNKIVISDRYLFSSLAYGMASGVSFKKLLELNKKFISPDIVFFLRVRPQICIERIKKRGEKLTLFEDKKRLEKVYKNYQKIFKKIKEDFAFLKCQVKIINGEGTISKVFNGIKKIIQKELL